MKIIIIINLDDSEFPSRPYLVRFLFLQLPSAVRSNHRKHLPSWLLMEAVDSSVVGTTTTPASGMRTPSEMIRALSITITVTFA